MKAAPRPAGIRGWARINTISRSKLGWFLASAVLTAGIVAAFGGWNPGGGQRLMRFGRARNFMMVANDRLYFIEGRNENSVVELTTSGVRTRVLTSDLPPQSNLEIQHAAGNVLVSWLEYLPNIAPRRDPLPPGTYPIPMVRRRRVLRFSREGGSGRELLSKSLASQAAAVGKSLFWVRPGPDAEVIPLNESRDSRTYLPRSDLMLLPPGGGRSHRVATGLASDTVLIRGDARVYWQSSVRDREQPPALYSVTADGGDIRMIENVYTAGIAPVERGDWVYWLHARMVGSSDGNSSGYRRSLVTARVDGTERRELLQLPPGRYAEWLGLHRGVLYCVTASGGEANPRQVVKLNRVHLAEPASLEPIATLPRGVDAGGQFDGDYFYFVVREMRENWLDWSPRGLYPRQIRTLCRIRLPE